MSHQIFAIKTRPVLDADVAKKVTYAKGKIAKAAELGLAAQAAFFNTDALEIERGGIIEMLPLTEHQLAIWKAFLPTSYVDDTKRKKRNFGKYSFDRIPGPVLDVWKMHRDSGLFERFEIWTPEKPRARKLVDPILVGINGKSHYLLARWGESDASLLNFDDIKRELTRRWKSKNRPGIWFCSTIATAMLGGFAWFGLLDLVLTGLPLWLMPWVKITYFSAVFLVVNYGLWALARLDDQIMQAIAKDKTVLTEEIQQDVT